MTKNERADTCEKLSHATARQKPAELDRQQEETLAKAQSYLLIEAKRPMLWTVAGIREEKSADGSRQWIIAVHVRYPTGHEGYLGDLLYDGMRITELTALELMRERGRQIAADFALEREWNEYRRSSVSTGKA